jgi:CTP synthase (UTP-ammonia lyase)
MKTIRVGILGDRNPQNETHIGTEKAIADSAASPGPLARVEWLATDQAHDYAQFDALWCSPGSPYRSLEGALVGIRYAREHRIPFIGTCGGCQHAILEFARNVLGIGEAAHAEYTPEASTLFITPLSCSLVGKTMPVRIAAGSRAAESYGTLDATEAYYCNFGLNPAYEETLQSGGLSISGRDEGGEVRIVELPEHRFFVGTLFVPQMRSRPDAPHPLVTSFLRVAIQNAG